jgi:hypothetical protein
VGDPYKYLRYIGKRVRVCLDGPTVNVGDEGIVSKIEDSHTREVVVWVDMDDGRSLDFTTDYTHAPMRSGFPPGFLELVD